jgi:GntR family transcriptional regulator
MTPPSRPRAPLPESLHSQVPPIRIPRTLVAEVTANLRQALVDGTLAPRSELPTEPELARQLGVSRGTLRQSIAILEQEGLVSRRHGLGTFVVPHTARLRNVLNNNSGVTELIRSTGGLPGTALLTVSRLAAEGRVAEKLGVSAGEPLILIERVRTADGLPVAYTVDHLPAGRLQSRGIGVDELERVLHDRGSLYACLREAGLVVDGGVADLRAVNADRWLAARLQVKVGAPLLLLGQVDYEMGGAAIIYSDEYLPAYLTVQVWRKGPG